MKKMLSALLLAAVCVIVSPVTAKANAANQANNLYTMQNNWYNQQLNYYNTYQAPVVATYDQIISTQYSQSLAALYQAQWMAQQSQARAAANNFQLGANYNAHMMNLNSQYQNMMNQYLYNYQNTMNTMYFNNLGMVNNTYGAMLGQYPFPQVP